MSICHMIVRYLFPVSALLAVGCQPLASPFTPGTRGIVEEASMSRVLREVGPGTLVVFDIDNTLIEPQGHLGSDQWYDYLVESGASRGLDSRAAIEQADRAFNVWQDRIEVQSVDPASPQVMADLDKKAIPYFALTARSAGAMAVTERQLTKAGFHLPGGGFHAGSAAKPGKLGSGAAYGRGVFYVGELGLTKGEALARILDLSGIAPKRVVFVDDKAKHTRTVQESMEKRGISCLCLRFNRADGHVRAFRQDMAHASELMGGRRRAVVKN